jgi:hypothetical protein
MENGRVGERLAGLPGRGVSPQWFLRWARSVRPAERRRARVSASYEGVITDSKTGNCPDDELLD